MPPKLAYLCLFENPSAEPGRALIRQFVLVREADRMGYDHIWLAEHHHDPLWPSGAIMALLGHAAAVTSHARIGPLALVPAQRALDALAEDLATVDLLSKGRLQLGVSRGSPFAASPTRAEDVVPLTQALLARLRGEGEGPQVVPVLPQAQLPVWVATTTEAGARAAARAGWGLVVGATATLERLQRLCAAYRDELPGADPRVLLVRFAMTADTAEAAEAMALPYLEPWSRHMAAQGCIDHPGETLTLSPQALMEASLVGSHAEVEARMRALGDLGVQAIAIVPTSAQFDTVKHCLADVVDEVRPLLSDD